ncbi:MAG: 30S ribosomal protein S4 [Candidatus Micrarchaeota archaeon]|nr:30S ribosomal protein S4 [Candidatus Micrarchaeota archaeon]
MGAPKKRRKQFEAPKRLWDAARIKEERKLVDEYGLKNMRELWRMKTILRKIRREARRLQSAKGKKIEERTQLLLNRVKSFLIADPKSLDEVLALDTRSILERRLQTRAVRMHLATTMLQSRQFIAHGHFAVKDSRVTAPSYLVKFNEENAIGWYKEPIVLKHEEVKVAN